MGAVKAMDHIYYVGVQDYDLRVFDIIMRSEYGTSYNSYLVRGSEKTALFETCKLDFWDEYIANIKEVCDPSEIDYIVVNHTEPDHAGCTERLLELAPNAQVVGSSTALSFLKDIVNHPVRGLAVTEEDTLDLGGLTLKFLSVPFLHWPDSMYTYIPELGALFTCDSFGCHYADKRIFNDLIDGDFIDAYHYYFTHIMGPFKRPFMLNALDKIQNLDIRFVGNGHGPVLRSNIQKYFDMYRTWCEPVEHTEKTAAIAYVSAYGYTKSLAEAIAKGIEAEGIKVQVFDLVTADMNAAKHAVSQADGFLLGSPTLLSDALPPIYEMLLGINPVIHKGRFAGAFGSYGWSGEAVPNLMTRMQQLKLSLPLEGMKIRFKPTQDDLDNAVEYGKKFAQAILGK